ncbi:MAG: glycosyltransferase family 4 protein [Candidatus Omnitrophica bacterium]|nr:glycosyltransferase family 4 protein [Candidatus Omnitrophota bacterium]
MNILLLTTHLNIGGIPRYVINLAKSFASQGGHVFLASSKGFWQGELEEAENIKLVFIPINTKSILSLKVIKSFFVLSRFLKDNKVDIIHANTRVTQFLACLLYRVNRIPYVSTFHGCYRTHLFRRLFKCQGLVSIAVSNFVKEHAVVKLGLKDEDIRVIHNGLDIKGRANFRPQDEEVPRDKLKGYPIIGTVSRLTPEKNIRFLIEAMPLILNKFPQACLVILGQGKEEGFLRKTVQELSLESKVIFLKKINPYSVYNSLDVFISLSTDEPFGFNVIEAQISEVPVIVSLSGALKEIVDDRINGLCLKDKAPGSIIEALTFILENEESRKAMIVNARKKVESCFSLERMARDTLAVYKLALEKDSLKP